jgi:hypothetical protein
VPKNMVDNSSSTKTNTKEVLQEEKKKVNDKTDGRSNRFYPPKDGKQQQTVGNKKIPSLPESEPNSYKKKKSRMLSRETAYYQERKHREI